VPDGPAAQGGLQPGDIITAFNGKDVVLSSDLPHLVGRVRPGTEAKVTIVRHGKTKQLTVEIGALPSDGIAKVNGHNKHKGTPTTNRLGVAVVNLTPQQQKQLDIQGVMVKTVGPGPGANAGLVAGDVITMIHNDLVRDIQDFERVVENLPANRAVPMQIVRRGNAMFIPLRVN